MWEFFYGSYSIAEIGVLCLAAVLIGVNKTGVPGLGMIPVLLLADFFEPRESTGLQLVMLGLADILAVIYYRRQADWKIVLRLMPWALLGIGLGILTLKFVADDTMKPVLAWTILFMVVFSYVAKYIKNADKMPDHWAFSAFFGMLAGLTTHVANAAGPVMAIYLLSMKLEKKAYIGSAAWYFLILNWLKIPIFAYEGRITFSSIKADITMIPLLVAGAALGIVLLNKLPQKRFEQIVQGLAALGALKMLIWP
jgi:uncharacterized membrane protein YfcA